ncbi:MAG TPA: hypothetical protein VGG12_03380, partial [Methylovirgula sp.]
MSGIDLLDNVKPTTLSIENWYPLFNAKNLIEAVYSASVYTQYLTVSREKANELLNAINGILDGATAPDNAKPIE